MNLQPSLENIVPMEAPPQCSNDLPATSDLASSGDNNACESEIASSDDSLVCDDGAASTIAEPLTVTADEAPWHEAQAHSHPQQPPQLPLGSYGGALKPITEAPPLDRSLFAPLSHRRSSTLCVPVSTHQPQPQRQPLQPVETPLLVDFPHSEDEESSSVPDTPERISTYDFKGRCPRHPHNRLRRKKFFGLRSQWEVKMTACPDCCMEELLKVCYAKTIDTVGSYESSDDDSSDDGIQPRKRNSAIRHKSSASFTSQESTSTTSSVTARQSRSKSTDENANQNIKKVLPRTNLSRRVGNSEASKQTKSKSVRKGISILRRSRSQSRDSSRPKDRSTSRTKALSLLRRSNSQPRGSSRQRERSTSRTRFGKLAGRSA
mmetsp:Transcript_11557/g.24648  ORF Transcript_11557/g.24648 Transcript_11557/m.24648 type:complete len:377 (+) Transcript_11557:135-1265(+)